MCTLKAIYDKVCSPSTIRVCPVTYSPMGSGKQSSRLRVVIVVTCSKGYTKESRLKNNFRQTVFWFDCGANTCGFF